MQIRKFSAVGMALLLVSGVDLVGGGSGDVDWIGLVPRRPRVLDEKVKIWEGVLVLRLEYGGI